MWQRGREVLVLLLEELLAVVATYGEVEQYGDADGAAAVVVVVVDDDKQTLLSQLSRSQLPVALYTTQPLLSLRYSQLALEMEEQSTLAVEVVVPIFVVVPLNHHLTTQKSLTSLPSQSYSIACYYY